MNKTASSMIALLELDKLAANEPNIQAILQLHHYSSLVKEVELAEKSGNSKLLASYAKELKDMYYGVSELAKRKGIQLYADDIFSMESFVRDGYPYETEKHRADYNESMVFNLVVYFLLSCSVFLFYLAAKDSLGTFKKEEES